MTAQLTKIKATPGVQALLNAGFGQGPAIVTKNYKQLGLTVPLYQSHGVASKEFIKLAGDAAEGVRLPAAALLVAEILPDGDAQKPVVVAYKRDYEAKYKSDVSTFGGHAYDGLMLAVDAIKRAGSTDKAKVRDAIENTHGYVGTGGVVNMSATDHMGLDLTAFRMLEVRNGNWALVKYAPTKSIEAAHGQQWVQFLAGGLTVGAIYALVALGFSIIFNASHVINFAQGEFVMIGGMSAVSLVATGVPMPLAIAGAVVIAGAVRPAAREIRGRAGAQRRRGDLDHHHHRCLDPAARRRATRLGQADPRAAAALGRPADRGFRRDDRAAKSVGARRHDRDRRRAVVVLRPDAVGQGDARHVSQPACRATGRHRRPPRCCSRVSGWPRRSARWPAC